MAVKKPTGGGKGAWNKVAIEDLSDEIDDPNDPIYASDEAEEGKVILQLVHDSALTSSAFDYVISEYFLSGDSDEALKNLRDFKYQEGEKSQFVKKILTIALEKSAFERELTSQLLSKLYGNVFTPEQIEGGFTLALARLEDSVLDNPDAASVLGKFMARAVMDEILAPAFVKDSNGENALAKEALGLAHGMITEKHRSGRLEHIWGPGDLSSVKRLKEEVNLMLEEYLVNADLTEAEASLRKLNAPSFYFYTVKQAIRLGIQRSSSDRDKMHQLLSLFSQIGALSPETIKKGFQVCYDSVSDLSLDVPDAKKLLDEFSEKARSLGYLT